MVAAGPNSIEIDYGEGDVPHALDRTMRSFTLMAESAISKLTELGWRRQHINLEIPDEQFPCYVKLRRKRVFEMRMERLADGRIRLSGEWMTDHPKTPGVIDRFMGWADA